MVSIKVGIVGVKNVPSSKVSYFIERGGGASPDFMYNSVSPFLALKFRLD